MGYSQAWLEDPSAIKGILVEVTVRDIVAAQEKVIYLSNIGYMTTDSQTSYLPYISGGMQFTESLPIDGAPTLSFGDIEINNNNGDLDDWLDTTKYVWVNRSIQIYLGDPFWKCTNIADVHTQFKLIFNGVVADIDSKNRNKLNIKVRDKMELLNVPVTDIKVNSTNGLGVSYGNWASGQQNQDTTLPLVFGEIFNATPLLIDPSQQEFMVCHTGFEGLIEFRDNGVPIYTRGSSVNNKANVDLATGKVKTTKPLVGSPTVSVQGIKNSINLTTGALVTGTYVNNIANLIALITTQYGTNKLTASDIDLPNFTSFAANTATVGISIADNTTVLSACQQLVNSIGGQMYFNRLGKLQLLRLGDYTNDTIVYITDADVLHKSLSISNRTTVIASSTIGYCRNWVVQENLQTAIYPEDKTNFAVSTYTKTYSDADTRMLYKLPADPTTIGVVGGTKVTTMTAKSVSGTPTAKETLLLKGVDAEAEATRLVNYFKTPRTVYSFTGTSKLMSLALGQKVNLTMSRFGLSSGKDGQVISLSPNWMKGTITVEVIV